MYESFYKLRSSPFQLIPDSRFFYDSDTHRQGLMRLRQAIHKGNQITAVTGEPGTGKTQLMQKFIDEFDAKKTVIARIPLTSLRANNILDSIAAAFGVVDMGFVGDALWSKKTLIGKIQQQITLQAMEGKKFIVVIDNAETISKSCLKKVRQLCSVSIKGAPLVQCFLFGEATIVRKLDASDDYCIRLDSFDQRESRRYIEHRLMEAGWQGDPEITESAFSMIYHISEGVPWHINLLCHRVLLQGFLEDSHVIDECIVSEFADEQQRQQLEVAGSDVATKSNVVNLKSSGSGSRVKGTSFNSASQRENSRRNLHQSQGFTDSISYFFGEPEDLSVDVSRSETQASVKENQDEYVASMLEAIENGELFKDLASATEVELSYPEKSGQIDPIEPGAMNTRTPEVLSDSPGDPIQEKPSTSILEKIFPETIALLQEQNHATPQRRSRVYPALDVPGIRQEATEDPDQLVEEQLDNNELPAQPSVKTPTQIAARASIVTSLAITLVMWVISDSHDDKPRLPLESVSTPRVMQSPQTASSEVNTMSPSPFENPDDSQRSRVILKK